MSRREMILDNGISKIVDECIETGAECESMRDEYARLSAECALLSREFALISEDLPADADETQPSGPAPPATNSTSNVDGYQSTTTDCPGISRECAGTNREYPAMHNKYKINPCPPRPMIEECPSQMEDLMYPRMLEDWPRYRTGYPGIDSPGPSGASALPYKSELLNGRCRDLKAEYVNISVECAAMSREYARMSRECAAMSEQCRAAGEQCARLRRWRGY